MARINSYGLDELMRKIGDEVRNVPGLEEEMLESGAQVMEAEIKRQIKAFGVYDLGATHDSIMSRMVQDDVGHKAIEIWPSGKRLDSNHKKWERIETVAFINEYGTSKKAARPFMSTAVRVAAKDIDAAMLKVLKEKSKL